MYFRRNLKSIFIKCPWKALKLFINPKGRNLIRTTSKLCETVAAFWRQLGHTPKTVYKVAVADSFKEWRNHEAVPTGFFFFSVTFPMVEMGCWLQVPMDLSTVAPESKHQFLMLGMTMMMTMILTKMMMTTDALCL